MDFGEMFRVMRRRWFVTVPALLLTVTATCAAYVVWPTKYQSTAQLTMLSSQRVAAEPANGNNPYLSFDTSLVVVVDILGRNLSSDQSAHQLQALGVKDAYTAAIAQNAQGPFLQLTLTGINRARLRQSMPVLIDFAQKRLAQLQEATNAPKRSLIRSTLISPPSDPAPVLKSKIELVAGVAVLGLILSFMLTFITDGILGRRARRRTDGEDGDWAAGRQERRAAARPAEPRSDWPGRASEPARLR